MIDTIINRLRVLGAERDYLLDALELWEIARVAGYEPKDVKAFSFRPEFLTFDEKRENTRRSRFRQPIMEQSKFHNCVRLVTGELKPIPLTKRPSNERVSSS